MRRRWNVITLAMLAWGCGPETQDTQPGEGLMCEDREKPGAATSKSCVSLPASTTPSDAPIALTDLQDFTRCASPVLRDPTDAGGYEVASDGHIFHDEAGSLRMVYSGDIAGKIGPRIATSTGWDAWTPGEAMLGASQVNGADQYRETPFYRRAKDGTHQLYYVGYEEEGTYVSEIYLATSDTLQGPYTMPAAPLIKSGDQAGKPVYLMTSPSVMEHEGELLMMYLAWNANPSEVTEVWVMGAVSQDDGVTWGEIREVETPIGMEGQLTRGPDGMYYAVRQGESGGKQTVELARASHPFGPYEALPKPVLTQESAPWEVHELNAPQLVFDAQTRTAYLYYVGADYCFGWWMMVAQTQY